MNPQTASPITNRDEEVAPLANIESMLEQATKDMNDAEDALVRAGFPEEQWLLMRKYILSAINMSHLDIAKRFQDLPVTGNE
jgi:hypothetical protein